VLRLAEQFPAHPGSGQDLPNFAHLVRVGHGRSRW
jgi:hypothetical protein